MAFFRDQNRSGLGHFLLVAVLVMTTACTKDDGGGDSGEPPPPSPPSSDVCLAPASWFPQSQTPKPDPSPAGGFQSFCDFHQWAWQSFLWLTQDVDGQPRFTVFPTSQDVIDGNLGGDAGPMRLTVRTGKTNAPQQPLSEINQAGERGILVDQNGRAVYYAQNLNGMMAEEIVSKQWNDPTVLQELPPTTVFQTGDVELKSAWKVVVDGESTEHLFVRSAWIDRLTEENGTIVVDEGSDPIEVQVALVGLHIAGWVEGHPEAIWATFEYRDNAPDMAKDQSPSAPVSDRDWLFYAANTLALDCNQLSASELKLDEATQTLSPVTQVCRQFPFGMVPDSSSAADQQNLAAILSLNASVLDQLASDNVWRNYFEVGAIWTNGDLQPNNDQQANLKGSTLLANSVIETFNQAVQSQNNCFQCHNTLMYNPTDPSIQPLQGTNLNISHVILEAYVDNQPSTGGAP